MSEKVLLDFQDRVAVVTINRPERHNALDREANLLLFHALQQADQEPSVVAIVIRGAGDRAFCSGADTSELPGRDTAGSEDRISFGGGLTGVGGAWLRCTRPTIAVVRGWALGGGFELAVACDIVLATDDARFGIPEATVGILGDSLVVHRAMRHLPYHVAMDLILTGRILPAAEAAHLGLVSAVASPDALDSLLEDRLARLRVSSPAAVRTSKEVALSGLEVPLETALSRPYPSVETYVQGPDYAEAMAAIRDRQSAVWRMS